jgi:hypothetical protein
MDGGYAWYRTGYETALRQRNLMPRDRDLAELRWAHAQARVAIRKGNIAEARRHEAAVKSLLDKGTNPDQVIQYPYLSGYIALYAKDFRRAIQALHQADQQDPFILLLLARAHEGAGDAAAARASYRKVLASNSHAVNNALARPAARLELASASR